MHATRVSQPFHTKSWVYEGKYDGWRIVAIKDKGHVRFISRNERDHTQRFGNIADVVARLKPDTHCPRRGSRRVRGGPDLSIRVASAYRSQRPRDTATLYGVRFAAA